MTKMEVNNANDNALEMGILLSLQQEEYGTSMLETTKEEDNDEIMGYTMQGLTMNEARLYIFKNRHSNFHNKNSSPPSSRTNSIHHFKIHDFDTCEADPVQSDFRSIDQAKMHQYHHVDKLVHKCNCPTSNHDHHKCDHVLCHGIAFKEEHVLHHGMSEFYHQSLEATSPQSHHILHHGLAFSNEVGLKCAHFNHHNVSPVISEKASNVVSFLNSNSNSSSNLHENKPRSRRVSFDN